MKDEWRSFANELNVQTGLDELALDWGAAGLASGLWFISVDPANEPRLRAMAEGSPIRARRIDIGSQDDEVEFMFDQGFSDGLPLSTANLSAMAMLSGTKRDAQEVLGEMAPNMGEVCIESRHQRGYGRLQTRIFARCFGRC